MTAPCKDCPDRHDVCWQDCGRYKDYKMNLEKIKRQMTFDRAQDSLENRRIRRNKIKAEFAKKFQENS